MLRACCKGEGRSKNLHQYHGGAPHADGSRSIVLGVAGSADLQKLLGSGTTNDKAQCRPVRPAELAVRIAIRVLMGLEDLHSEGFVHCDLGFENVMVTDRGAEPAEAMAESAQLIDFGRCATIAEGRPRFGGGVWELMPHAQHNGSVSPTTDVQTAAALLVLLLLGEAPFYPGDELYRRGDWEAYKVACQRKASDVETIAVEVVTRVEECLPGSGLGDAVQKGLKGEYKAAVQFYKALDQLRRNVN